MKMQLATGVRGAALVALLCGAAATAQAQSFSCITGSAVDCGLAESSLSWSWDGLDFTIANTTDGYVSEVYFDLSAGMSASFLSGIGTVSFAPGASPGALPGGSGVSFVSDAAFDSDPGTGAPVNGINVGESATFRISGAALDSFDIGALAAGVHVRSLITDSASLVTAVSAIPEPQTYALMLAGVGAVGFVASRRRRR